MFAVCEKNGRFGHLFENEPSIESTYRVRAGKFRRYAGQSTIHKLTDFKTIYQNIRDIFYTLAGYWQAVKLLKKIRPDGILIKGGFVAVPVGLAAARLRIPFITHDSDSTPGLANRLISRWATMHATGMPAEFYGYPKSKVVYTGTPVAPEFKPVTEELRRMYAEDLGLSECDKIVTVIGASQGADELNRGIISIAGRLMQNYKTLGIINIVGQPHEETALRSYKKELLADELQRVIVKGFVSDVYRHTGAADVVVTRASATVIAELAIQGQASIVVPGQLAGDHQKKNALELEQEGMSKMVAYGDSEGLFNTLNALLGSVGERVQLANKLHTIAKPDAARELARLLLECVDRKASSGT